MIGYVTIGVSDLEKARDFYGKLFAAMGGKELFGFDRIKFYGTGDGQPMLAICVPFNENEAACGNGNMVAFAAGGKPEVDVLYAKAIELGAVDEGEPGQRIEDTFYGAYVRDFDGNKLCFYEMS